MKNTRLFIKKHPTFATEANNLFNDLCQNLHLQTLKTLRIVNIYDLFNLDNAAIELAKYVVFAEANVDQVYIDSIDLAQSKYFAYEYLPGQYDQRADSAMQALQLLGIDVSKIGLTCAKLLVLNSDVNPTELAKIQNYLINPLECRLKDLSIIEQVVEQPNYQEIPSFCGFTKLSEDKLSQFIQDNGLAMSLADLQCVASYFRKIKRNPTETEINVLDTYWSDHCRHTTFETHLNQISFAPGKYKYLFEKVFATYNQSRVFVHGDKLSYKPITLMDLATICAKEQKKLGNLSDVEFSSEINACSLLVDIKEDGQTKKWSLQFKNETHNHPTEIEPYGGASTCVGGAIRDPLSGRSYVFQAMRISGAANPLEPIEATLPGKLPQKVITTKAAHGFSSYGNQIGLATTYVKEVYHPGYKAKRMEVGMVVGAAPYANIKREEPRPGDLIVLIGGMTGRDGCGGATGSSKEHDQDSLAKCGSEVQKGNPIIERKIQRLFRNPNFSVLIKKCNDFGAGGVSVAIGELADGVTIDLDKVPTKYAGLTGTELAISESQERMAIVIDPKDLDQVNTLTQAENLIATVVAKVSADNKMTMHWNNQTIVELDREFLNTNGASATMDIVVKLDHEANLFQSKFNQPADLKLTFNQVVQDLNICSQEGLVDRFDATIGATTVLMPFGGKYQLTESQVSIQKFPTQGVTNDVSIASFAYDPELSTKSPFHGAYYAVLHSIAKIVAVGGDYSKIKFSFQEYFEKLGADSVKWGKPFSALLGAYALLQEFKLCAIGGKDSMSGTFKDINVPPTLISFAVATADANQIISPEFKHAHQYIYMLMPKYNQDDTIDSENLIKAYQRLNQLIINKQVDAAYAIGYGGMGEALIKMSLGNKIGVKLDDIDLDKLFINYYGAIVFTSNTKLNEFTYLGVTTDLAQIQINNQTISLDELIQNWQSPLSSVFPKNVNPKLDRVEIKALDSITKTIYLNPNKIANPRVIIPVFPGINCEYDSVKAFDLAKAQASSLVFRNQSSSQIEQSIIELSKQINNSQILMLPGGFSLGDEPDGSAKFIVAILKNSTIKDAVHQLLERGGLILGICNGFQALIKSGLLPYGEICDLDQNAPTLTHNLLGRHISRICNTKVVNNHSPWLSSFKSGEIHQVAFSHGEGRFVADQTIIDQLIKSGQIACQYVDNQGNPTMEGNHNPNGSVYAIESITSADGRILGKMGHSERFGDNLYKNIPGNNKHQDIFTNGVNYFK